MIPARVAPASSTNGATATDLLPRVSYGCVRDCRVSSAASDVMGERYRAVAVRGPIFSTRSDVVPISASNVTERATSRVIVCDLVGTVPSEVLALDSGRSSPNESDDLKMRTRRTRDGARRSRGRMTFKLALAGVVLMVGTAVACGSSGEDTGSDAPLGTTDEGSWYDRANWPHDGDRIETANFVVFSDSAHSMPGGRWQQSPRSCGPKSSTSSRWSR